MIKERTEIQPEKKITIYQYATVIALLKEATGKNYRSNQIKRLVDAGVLEHVKFPGNRQGGYTAASVEAYLETLREFYSKYEVAG